MLVFSFKKSLDHKQPKMINRGSSAEILMLVYFEVFY